MIKHIKIRVKGIVQGVGFRPFIFNIAMKYNIKGTVINDTEGVLIHAQGSENDIGKFFSIIKINPPALSYIIDIKTEELPEDNYTVFSIEKSSATIEKNAFYSPDMAICDECLSEYMDINNRRNLYPFITCINCGPRFSIINDIPYDRHNTEMKSFHMCENCLKEYRNPIDRRFHSQPNACPDCGPIMEISEIKGKIISNEPDIVLKKTLFFLDDGNIIAIKGIGGYHLAVDAKNDSAVKLLRHRKKRPFKPFALMSKDISNIKDYCHISIEEEELLLSKERPIVLLKIKKEFVSREVAPQMSYLGIMLPSTPFQHSLFSDNENLILIMTSGNISDEPIIYRDDNAKNSLSRIADYIVTYNREISGQSDDSVLYVQDRKSYFIRRARGYVPQPFLSSITKNRILAMGGDIKNCFAIAKDDFIILSQHLGDMADPATHRTFKKTINHFKHIFHIEPDTIVSDLHPSYMTTLFAEELINDDIKSIKVQHHHAHIASVIEENKIEGDVIGIAFDGTGYGEDGTLWGSEFLTTNLKDYKRATHFSTFPLPGGESAIKDVWKIGTSLLHSAYGEDIPIMEKTDEVKFIINMIEKKINCPETCSIGRLFDGVSSILNISNRISTEAEAAQLLEEEALKNSSKISPFTIPFKDKNTMIIDTAELIKYIVSLIKNGKDTPYIAYAFHLAIAYTSAEVTAKIGLKSGINRVALSGGVFHNRIILSLLMKYLKEKNFEVYTPSNIPFNDGCISLGQIAVAKERLKIS